VVKQSLEGLDCAAVPHIPKHFARDGNNLILTVIQGVDKSIEEGGGSPFPKCTSGSAHQTYAIGGIVSHVVYKCDLGFFRIYCRRVKCRSRSDLGRPILQRCNQSPGNLGAVE
jgi:hypothetical protein